MATERILIIDDKIEIISFLTDLLKPLGYALFTALDGKEGLALALAEQPDLILLDVHMPGMSGMEVLETLHQQAYQPPVILMTLYGSESVAVRALRRGVRDYINKPFDINELLKAIEQALEEGRLRRERERLVIELSETNEKLMQRMQELAALQAVGHSVASLMPRRKLLCRIIDAAILLAEADAGTVFLLDAEDGKLCLQAVRQGETYHFGLRTKIEDNHAQDVLQSGQPLWISGPTKRTGVTRYLGQQARSMLYVPIKRGDTVIGVMGVACLQQDRTLSQEVRDRLVALADYAAIALTNTQLYEDLQCQAQRLATVNHIAQVVAHTLDLDRIVPLVVQAVKQSLRAEAAALVLQDEEHEELAFQIILGKDPPKQSSFRMAMGQGIVGWVVQHGQSLRVNDVSQDARFHAGIDQALGIRTHSILCAPLIVSDRAIGAIEAINRLDDKESEGRGRFTKEDEELLCGTAAFVAIAVENARLHATVRETIAAQTLHDTVVTLSHHVNNPLQALLGSAEMLRMDLGDHAAVTKAVTLIRKTVQEISVVISVLQDIVLPESAVYLGSISMLDIEKELEARLQDLQDPPPDDLVLLDSKP